MILDYCAKPLIPPHPFPARMAAEVALAAIKPRRKRLTVLDPMIGSGTTAAVAMTRGHIGLGFDSDPLAVVLANAWCNSIERDSLMEGATKVLRSAERSSVRSLGNGSSLGGIDAETRQFVDYWFDEENRGQLYALSRAIRQIRERDLTNALWCVFSRLIITKQAGATRAMDLAHSRPHRVRDEGAIRPYDSFVAEAEKVASRTEVLREQGRRGHARIRRADARAMPLEEASVDLIVTSPPYLNAIDYLRAHKFSLVWMGYSLERVRRLRRSSIGSEWAGGPLRTSKSEKLAIEALGDVGLLPERLQRVAVRYVRQLKKVLSEASRVLRPGAEAVFVIGNSTLRGVFLRNSAALTSLAGDVGLEFVESHIRSLPANRRYLPPPKNDSGKELDGRMRSEVVVKLVRQSR